MPNQDTLPDPVAQNVSTFADSIGKTADEVAAAVVETYESLPDTLEDTQRWDIAYKRGKKAVIDAQSTGGSGDVVTVITIGHGRVSQWPDRNHDNYREGMNKDAMPRKDVLVASGVVTREDDGRTALASIIFDSTDGVDLGRAMELFSDPYTVFSGRFSIAEPKTVSDGFVLYTTRDTTTETVDDPLPLEERERLVANSVDDVSIAEVANNPHANLSASNDYGAADFGLDLKCIRGATVYHHWVNDEGDRGVYTILDESVVGPSELEGTKLIGDNQHVPGLSAWAHGNLMQYGDGSICDFYGTIDENHKGQISMNVRGIDPVYAEPLDADVDGAGARTQRQNQAAGSVGNQSAESF